MYIIVLYNTLVTSGLRVIMLYNRGGQLYTACIIDYQGYFSTEGSHELTNV